MKRFWLVFIVMLIFIISENNFLIAEDLEYYREYLYGQKYPINHEATQEQIDKWIQDLKNGDPAVHGNAAFELALLKPKLKTEKVKQTLLDLMEKEEKVQEEARKKGVPINHGGLSGESYTDHYFEILRALATLKDVRTIPYLIKNFGHGDADRGLLDLGDPAAEALFREIEILKKKGISTFPPYPIMKILAEMVRTKEKGYIAKGKIRETIKKIAINTLSECKHPQKTENESERDFLSRAKSRASSRRGAILILGNIGDKDVIPLIKKAANEDHYFQDFSKKKNCTGPKIKYPVREEAEKILDKLKKERKIKE